MSKKAPRRTSRGALHVTQARFKSQTATSTVDIDYATRQGAESTTKRHPVEFVPLPRERGDPEGPDLSPPSKSVRLSDSKAIDDFVTKRQSVARFVLEAIAAAVDKQKASANERGRKNREKFKVGDSVLLSTTGLKETIVTNLGASKLAPRYISPFKVIKVKRDAYKLDIPSSMRLHPTFYVGRLKRYWPAVLPSTADQQPGHNAALDNAGVLADRAGAAHATPRCLDGEQRLIAP